MRRQWYIGFGVVLGLLILRAIVWGHAEWLPVILVPLGFIWIYDLVQTKHTILRNFPVLGHIRYIFEFLRPEVQQYFVASDEE